MNTKVTEYINSRYIEQQEIMNVLRALVRWSVENVSEGFKWSRPVFRLNKDFTYFQADKNHVTLGFYNGFGKLNDPKDLLEGTGKTMRHIKIKSVNDIDQDQIKEWLVTVTKD